MGEKPLGIDEAPAQMATIAGGASLGGVGAPTPAMAAGSLVAMPSIIKSSGSAAAASQLPKGLEPTPTRPGDPVPVKPGPAGMAIKEQGAKVDGGAAGAEGVGQTAEHGAMESDPIPGADVKLGRNPGGAAYAAVPGAEVDNTIKSSGSVTEPSGATPVGGTPPPPPGPSDGGAAPRPNGKRGWYRTQRTSASRSARERAAPVATWPGGDGGMRAGEPIPGIDVKLGKNPGGQGDTGPARPEPLPGPSPDRKPIPGIDDAEKKKA